MSLKLEFVDNVKGIDESQTVRFTAAPNNSAFEEKFMCAFGEKIMHS